MTHILDADRARAVRSLHHIKYRNATRRLRAADEGGLFCWFQANSEALGFG